MSNTVKEKFFRNHSYIIACAVLILIHVFIRYANDDLSVRNALQNSGGSAIHMAINLYFGWEGSFFCQLVMCLAIKYLICFKFLNILMCMLAIWSFGRLFSFQTSKENYAYISTILFLLYPLGNLSTAGWVVTCVVYLWVVAAALYSLTISKKVLLEEHIRPYEYVLGLLALILGSNREQSALFLILFFTGILIYCIINKKKYLYILIQLIISSANFGSLLLSPGISQKSDAYIVKVVPDIQMYNFFEKFYIVLSDTMNYFLAELKIPILLFAIVLVILTFQKTDNTIKRLISTYPVFYIIVVNMLAFPSLQSIFKKSGTINLININTAKTFIPIIMQLLWIGCIVATLWIIFNNSVHFWLLMLVLTAGMASKMALCMSSAFIGSRNRTYIFMFFSILYCTGYTMCYEKNLLNCKVFRCIMNILVALTIINLILALRMYGGVIPHWIDKY